MARSLRARHALIPAAALAVTVGFVAYFASGDAGATVHGHIAAVISPPPAPATTFTSAPGPNLPAMPRGDDPATTHPAASPTATPGAEPSASPSDSPSATAAAPSPAAPGSTHLMFTTGTQDVALTFDDGPSPYTGQLLDLLDQYQVKATFCLIGEQVHAYAAVVRRMVADGMTLCNHTWDHDLRLRSRSDAVIRRELVRTNDAIHAVVPDAPIQYFRNPGGNFGPNTVSVAASLGMAPLMWDVDPRDWARPGTASIISIVSRGAHPGAIVLSHDGGGDRTQTLAAYRVLLPSLRSRYTLIALPTTTSAASEPSPSPRPGGPTLA